MTTKKIQGDELKRLVESLAMEVVMEQLPPWIKKALADPKTGAALDAALKKQYDKRNSLPKDEKEKEALDYEAMNLVAQTHPTEKERQRMRDIFGEAFGFSSLFKKKNKPKSQITKALSMRVGDALGIDWSDISPDEFHMGMNVEMEHGSKLGNLTNVTGDDLLTTGRIALAHLEELGDYYSRLKDIEGKASKVSTDVRMESLIMEYVREALREVLSEGEYQGRDVPLNKPMQGDVRKYKVYVKDPKTDNVKKVNFGDPNMSIKRDDPKRRKSFRARHKCSQKKDRTSPGYWSCRMWSSKPVSKILKGK